MHRRGFSLLEAKQASSWWEADRNRIFARRTKRTHHSHFVIRNPTHLYLLPFPNPRALTIFDHITSVEPRGCQQICTQCSEGEWRRRACSRFDGPRSQQTALFTQLLPSHTLQQSCPVTHFRSNKYPFFWELQPIYKSAGNIGYSEHHLDMQYNN